MMLYYMEKEKRITTNPKRQQAKIKLTKQIPIAFSMFWDPGSVCKKTLQT